MIEQNNMSPIIPDKYNAFCFLCNILITKKLCLSTLLSAKVWFFQYMPNQKQSKLCEVNIVAHSLSLIALLLLCLQITEASQYSYKSCPHQGLYIPYFFNLTSCPFNFLLISDKLVISKTAMCVLTVVKCLKLFVTVHFELHDQISKHHTFEEDFFSEQYKQF